eukprot:gnl/TRDRNA2_/TRDRNA2_177225_c0_seq25.p1 gnl/TRDRNA2_/TRDRNA2_177225_c0~~gnl/TRDRNA2_/TRDRNA2_177225_c0_seq25.p1  ORF type:complete len:702 (-),score=160.32 gnl/TRDRNA2_/TRDRNA2_177225_c0_seq25:174-2249(-)
MADSMLQVSPPIGGTGSSMSSSTSSYSSSSTSSSSSSSSFSSSSSSSSSTSGIVTQPEVQPPVNPIVKPVIVDPTIECSASSRSVSRSSGVIPEVGEDDGIGAPQAAAYKHEASHSVIDLLEDMRGKAEVELCEIRKAEQAALHNYELTVLSLKDEIASYEKEFAAAKAEAAAAAELKANAEGDLARAKAALEKLLAALENLLQSCRIQIMDFGTSKCSRADELRALRDAKSIIKQSTSDAATAVYGSASAAASFLQLGSESLMGFGLASATDLANFEVVHLVRKLAKEQNSASMLQLAGKIAAVMRFGSSSGEDKFAKVKGLIKEMIDKLTAEAEQEATHKEYCDKEMASANGKKDDLSMGIETMTAKIDQASSKRAQLIEEVDQLQKELAELQKMQLEMDKIRAEERSAFTELKSDLEAGINGVRRAIQVLSEHYGSASSFLQLKQGSGKVSPPMGGQEPQVNLPGPEPQVQPPIPDQEPQVNLPVPEPQVQPPIPGQEPQIQPPIPDQEPQIQPPIPGNDGAVGIIKPFPIPRPGPCPANSPHQGHGEAILDLLEVVESDFSKSLAEAQTSEDTAQAEYKSTTQKNNEDKIQKEMDVKYKSKEIVRLEKSLASLKSDLENIRSEYMAVLDYLKTLTDQCVAKPETYEERKRRREAEIAGLKEALRILTEEAAMMQLGKGSLRGVRRHW